MIGILVVTHGQLARELVTAAEMIVGDIPNVAAVSIGWHDDPDDAQKEILEGIKRVETGEGTVVLTDMFGGTPSNLSLAFLERDRVEVVTGVNLPMILKLADQQPDETLPVIARRVRDQGQKTIYLASEVLTPNKQ